MKRIILTLAVLAAAIVARAEAVPTIQELAARLSAVEEFVATQKVEIAQHEARRKAHAEKEAKRTERQRAYQAARNRYAAEFAAYEEKYGRLVLVGNDEENGQRIYKRADGVTVRFNVPKAVDGDETPTRSTRRRARK